MGALPQRPEAADAVAPRAALLDAAMDGLAPQAIVARAAAEFRGRIAAVSSFGAESAVLLHMIAAVDRHLPVVFLDTGKHFDETLAYRDRLVADLGLTALIIVSPRQQALAAGDPDGALHRRDADACCALRKVEPMARAVAPFDAWFTGRKRFQASSRAVLPVVEAVGPRLRINPLAAMDGAALEAYAARHGLGAHPLVAEGYRSIGCRPCTSVAAAGADARSGRWAGAEKTECGIHLSGLNAALTSSSL